MKRCPQCLFLYPDSDERCDFDKTALEAVSEAEIDAATSKPAKRKVAPIVAAAGLILGVLAFAIYYAINQYTHKASAATQTPEIVAPAPVQPVVISPSPSPTVSPSPSPSPSPSVKPSPTGISTSHSRSTTDPVSTSGPGIGQRQGVKPVIVLTTGARIDADEVWRTRDGVWYRRNGMVTLLKRGQVKAILTR
jgi:hypothetical protein